MKNYTSYKGILLTHKSEAYELVKAGKAKEAVCATTK